MRPGFFPGRFLLVGLLIISRTSFLISGTAANVLFVVFIATSLRLDLLASFSLETGKLHQYQPDTGSRSRLGTHVAPFICELQRREIRLRRLSDDYD